MRVLGPLEVIGANGPVDLTAAKERALAAVLAAELNHVVSVERIIDELWGESPPRSARRTVHSYVTRVRRVLGDAIVARPGGYELRLRPEELDVVVFEQQAAAGRLALLRDEPDNAAAMLGDALALWRGEAYADVIGHGRLRAEATRLEELRHAVTEDWLEARLAAGAAREVISDAEALVASFPLRERLWAALMRALHATGRQGDALRAYQRARERLIDELGVEPGAELRAVELSILHGVPARRAAPTAPATTYAVTTDGLKIGYWVAGSGPSDVVFCAEIFLNLELLSDFAEFWAFLEPIATASRLIAVQRRGTGVSDRDPHSLLSPPEACVADIDSVLGALGSDSVSLVGWGHGGQIALAYAALRPARVDKVVVVNCYGRLSAAPDNPLGLPGDFLDALSAVVESVWGTYRPLVPIFDPAIAYDPDVILRVSRLERLVASPREAATLRSELDDFDIRPLLPDVTCPVLVAAMSGSITGVPLAKALADELPLGQFVEAPGSFVPTVADAAALADIVVPFLRP